MREVVGVVAGGVLYGESVDVDRRAGRIADGDRLRLQVHGAGRDRAGWRVGDDSGNSEDGGDVGNSGDGGLERGGDELVGGGRGVVHSNVQHV